MKRRLLVSLVFVLAFSGTAYAGSGRFALSAKAGTLGLGAEVSASISPHFNARVGLNAFDYDYDGTESDVKYDIDLGLLSYSALLDWHPMAGTFRISGGVLMNENELDLEARPENVEYKIGNTTYTAAEVGMVTGHLDFDSVSPYLGVGWGNVFGKNRSWAVAVDLGVVFSGSPNVALAATNGTLTSDTTFLEELRREEKDLEDDVDDFKYYPVISVGATYRF